jgi:hypothetical protein
LSSPSRSPSLIWNVAMSQPFEISAVVRLAMGVACLGLLACGTGSNPPVPSGSSESTSSVSSTTSLADTTSQVSASSQTASTTTAAGTNTTPVTTDETSVTDEESSSDVPAVASSAEPGSEPASDSAAAVTGDTAEHTGACPVVELITNGAFDVSDETGWIQSSAKWETLVVGETEAGAAPHSGAALARLGGYVGTSELPADDTLLRTVPVPESATELEFSVHTRVTTEDAAPQGNDTLYIALDSEAVYADLALDDTDVHDTWQEYSQPVSDLAAGKTLVLLISTHNDDANATSFFVDSVSLKARVCP